MNYQFIYITTKNKEEARKIGRELVEKKLAACVNIIDNMNSIYWWETPLNKKDLTGQGKIQDDNEAVLIAKTKESLAEELIKKVKETHSYDCPCIVGLPIVNGNEDYLKWIGENTK
jgi:periplasmic divalent cation tolerance protein